MSAVKIASVPSVPRNDRGIDSRSPLKACGDKLRGIDKLMVSDPSVQRLLDVIAATIADEYIRVAKQNKDIFVDPRIREDDRGKRREQREAGIT